MVSAPNPVTYVSDDLNCSSFIDHCFVSHSIRQCLPTIDIVDSAINLSDLMPIVARFLFTCVLREQHVSEDSHGTSARFAWRWDKTNLAAHYEATRWQLVCLIADESECGEHCSCDVHCYMIDKLYNDIVSSIQAAALLTIIRIPSNSLKIGMMSLTVSSKL